MISFSRALARRSAARAFSSKSLDAFATLDPRELSGAKPHTVSNLVGGEWKSTREYTEIPDPLNGEPFIKVPLAKGDELRPFVDSLRACPKSGLHNPVRDTERYLMYGEVSACAAALLGEPEVADFFARLIQRVSPKSYVQALGEVKISRTFLQNFSGDQPRFLARGFTVPGDHGGQESQGMRWPFGPVAVITPFNFPIEIPLLQIMGALYMGNKPLLHVDPKVAIAMEQVIRMLHHCGMPAADMDFLNTDGPNTNSVLLDARPRNTLFTGSNRVAEKLTQDMGGRVRVEDAGFDWKIMGPDVHDLDYVSWQCDQDAYACSGQKCSAQSILFMHENWVKAGLEDKIRNRAQLRTLEDLTIGPVLTWTTDAILGHARKLLSIPGARLVTGGKELAKHTIPKVYGAVEPTAVFVPLDEILKKENFATVCTEIFGPMQVITHYRHDELPKVLEACERMENHLTAAVVSNDVHFINEVVGSTVNGTTYVGQLARTTGAPQNHWFGPSGDPRGAGIGTREAIQITWSSHREVIRDMGPVARDWTLPKRPT